MAYEIRPLSFAEILDRAFRVFRDHFSLLVSISAVAWIPYGVLLALGEATRTGLELVAVVFFLIVTPVTQAALTIAVADVYLDRPTTIGEAFQATRTIFLALIATYLLLYLLLIFAFLLLVIPGIYFSVCWVLAGPIMVVERVFGMAALRRSRTLVRGAWWRTLGIALLASVLVGATAGVLQVFWSFIPLIGPILNAATQAVTSTYGLVAVVIYYFDRRCRTEDFDLRFLAAQIRSESGAGAGAMPASSPVA